MAEVNIEGVEDDPWRVVQKKRKGKNQVEGRRNNSLARINEEMQLSGSRFTSLLSNNSNEIETVGLGSLAGKGKKVIGNSEIRVGKNNGNHDAIIKKSNTPFVS